MSHDIMIDLETLATTADAGILSIGAALVRHSQRLVHDPRRREPGMTPHRLLNLALAAAIAVVLSTSYLLDGQPTELDAIQATAASVIDAQNAARATARHTRTAQVQP